MLWSDLEWQDADALAKLLGDRVPKAVERFLKVTPDELELDFSRGSLARMWQWVIDQPNSGGVAEADDAEKPLWYRFSAETCQIHGTERSGRVATHAVALERPASDRSASDLSRITSDLAGMHGGHSSHRGHRR